MDQRRRTPHLSDGELFLLAPNENTTVSGLSCWFTKAGWGLRIRATGPTGGNSVTFFLQKTSSDDVHQVYSLIPMQLVTLQRLLQAVSAVKAGSVHREVLQLHYVSLSSSVSYCSPRIAVIASRMQWQNRLFY